MDLFEHFFKQTSRPITYAKYQSVLRKDVYSTAEYTFLLAFPCISENTQHVEKFQVVMQKFRLIFCAFPPSVIKYSENINAFSSASSWTSRFLKYNCEGRDMIAPAPNIAFSDCHMF
jgi:hypothetical protein